MKRLMVTLFLLLSKGLFSQEPIGRQATQAIHVVLDQAKTETLHAAPNIVTTLQFEKSVKVDQITKGSPMIEVKFSEDKNQLDIFPAVSEGVTNLNITSDGRTYAFIVKISPTIIPDVIRTYSTGEDSRYETEGSRSAPAIKPHEIDTISAIRTVERARLDGTFRATQANLRNIPIGKTWIWNSCPITLIEVNQFTDLDLLVLKIEWLNRSNRVLNLECRQIGLVIAATRIPITASQQVSARLFPGQNDIIYLFIQGHRISPRNEWRLVLPPDAAAVEPLFKK